MISWETFMDIIALHRQGFTERAIARKLHVHRNTVKKYLQEGQKPEHARTPGRESILAPYHPVIEDFLDDDNYRATWIFQRLRERGYTGGYDTVKRHVYNIKQKQQRQAYLRFETIPGLQGQMDWADFQVNDPQGVFSVYLFLLVLGYSRAMYATLVDRCTLQAFMDAHIEAFHYLGGIPVEVLYDNMKHVVIERKAGQVLFNTEFSHFARHYGFKPVACPPYSPWFKGKVERPVDYIRESFWRGYAFNSLEKANRDLRQWLNETANRRCHGTHRQAVDSCWRQEVPGLLPCPVTDYDTSIKEYRKVYRDCSISYGASRYQVPMDMIGKKVLLKIKDGTIRFYDDDRLLVSHPQARQKGSWITDPDITAQIRDQHRRCKRKYTHHKAQATRGLVDTSLFPQVLYRPLSIYDQISQGGGAWTS